jgi:hypothetical protein
MVSGCIPLPAPSSETVKDELSLPGTIQKGEAILIYGKNAPRPHYFGEPYFSMGCMLDYQGDTVGQLTIYMLKLNPVPGQFAIKTLDELQGAAPNLVFNDPVLTELNISEPMASQERLRYIIIVHETIDNTLHIPLYLIPFGISACSNEAVIEATIWEVPSGKNIGTITSSSKGEFTGLAYMLHIVLMPQTQSEAVQLLSRELLKKLTGVAPAEK